MLLLIDIIIMYWYIITGNNDEISEYNFLDTNTNLPYEYIDKYEVAKKILTNVALLHITKQDTGASLRQRSKRMHSLDFHQFGRRLRNKDRYSPLMIKLDPFLDHVRSLDSRGKLKININLENNNGQKYNPFFNRFPLYRLQMKTLQDSNPWIKNDKRYPSDSEVEDTKIYFNNVCLNLGQ